jgi:hypothetical protein
VEEYHEGPVLKVDEDMNARIIAEVLLLAPSSIQARLVGTTAVASGSGRARRSPWNDAGPEEEGA